MVTEEEKKAAEEEKAKEERVKEATDATIGAGDELAEEVAAEQIERVQNEDAKIAEGDSATEIYSDIPDRLRWSEQCFLAENVEEIARWQKDYYRREYAYIDTAIGHPSHFLNKMFDKPGSSEFTKMGPGDVSELMPMFELYKPLYEKVDNKKDGSISWQFKGEVPLVFEKMAQEDIQMARNPEAGDATPLDTLGTPTSWLADSAPGGDINALRDGQFPGFSYGSDNDIPAVGYGWTNFEWSFQGSNPSEVRNDITATLKLEFQNFDQLAQIRNAEVLDPDTKEPKNEQYMLLDLLGWGVDIFKAVADANTEEDRRKLMTDQYFQKRFEIKAVVGWHVPDHWQESSDGGSNIGSMVDSFLAPEGHDTASEALREIAGGEDLFESHAEKRKRYAMSLKAQQQVLYLTAIDHKFNILDIGRFTLTINYRARLEGILTQPLVDVLMTQTHRDQVDELDKKLEIARSNCDRAEIKQLEQEYESKVDGFRTSDLQSFIDTASDGTAWDETTTKMSDQRLSDMIPSATPLGYENLNRRFGQELDRIYTVKASAEQIKNFASGLQGAAADLEGIEASTDDTDPLSGLGGSGGTTSASEQTRAALDVTDTGLAAAQDLGSDEGVVIYTSNPDPLAALDGVVPFATNAGDVPIQFIYLGDIIEFFAGKALSVDNFKGNERSAISPDQASRIKIILGPYEFESRSEDSTGSVNINLADIPISVRAFTDFWYKNVIAKNRKTYPLVTFVRELVDQLVIDAMGARCKNNSGKPAASRAARVRTNFITLPSKDGTDPLKKLEQSAYDDNGDIWLDLLNIISTTGKTLNGIYDPELAKNQTVEDQYHYLMVFAESTTPHGLEGIEIDDNYRGIHHLRIHQGILKSIAFEKTDIPGYREARMEEQMQSKQWNPYIQLSNRYNIAFETVGNTLFYPGSYVYIDPVGEGTFGASIGSPMTDGSLSSIMGFGGYHMIISTTSTINAAGFSTSVQAMWDSAGTGKRNPAAPNSLKEDC